jgi:thiol:disulfide interchange protein
MAICTGQATKATTKAAILALMIGVALCCQAQAQTPEEIAAAKAAHKPVVTITGLKHIYPETEEATADVKAALAKAHREHKRVLLDFGGDWCPDCQVLDIYFHQSPNAELLAKNFVKVNVNIGHEDANLELAHRYGVPVHGVPALAVLDRNGKVLYAQDKEFSDMRYMQPGAVTDFLNKWKR